MPAPGRRTSRRWSAYVAAVALMCGFAGVGVAAHEADPDRTRSGAPRTSSAPSELVEFADEGVRLNRRARVSASAPASVRVGQRVRVTGVVKVRGGKKAKPRPLRLQQVVNGSTRTVATKKSTRTGSFAMVAPARTVAGRVSYKVSAPRSGRLKAVTSRNVVVTVLAKPRPAAPTEQPGPPVPLGPTAPSTASDPAEAPETGLPAPAGSAKDWAWLLGNGGGRWNPCAPIRWAYNPTGSYVGSLADMKRTFARIAGYTGLRFRYVGSTTYVHHTGAAYPANVDFAVAWTNEAAVPRLAGATLGFGGGSALPAPAGSDVAYQITRGYVLLDTAHTVRAGFARTGAITWGQVMTHEVLHGLGLNHAHAKTQVMHETLSPTNHLLGAGDLSGIAKIGSQGGCL